MPPKILFPFKPQTIRHYGHLTRQDRNLRNRHPSGILWFTGFSGSGKSTIAHGVEKELFQLGHRAYVLDGDNVRHGINSDLGFSRRDRKENIRRIVEIARLMVDAGLIVLASFISPDREDRAFVRQNFARDNFFEIYVKCSICECERRDPKGIYRLVRRGAIENFTGISAPYEEPEAPHLIIDTERLSVDDSIHAVVGFMAQVGLLGKIFPGTIHPVRPFDVTTTKMSF